MLPKHVYFVPLFFFFFLINVNLSGLQTVDVSWALICTTKYLYFIPIWYVDIRRSCIHRAKSRVRGLRRLQRGATEIQPPAPGLCYLRSGPILLPIYQVTDLASCPNAAH